MITIRQCKALCCSDQPYWLRWWHIKFPTGSVRVAMNLEHAIKILDATK